MNDKQYEVTIHLKSKRKPISFIFNSDISISKLVDELKTDSVVRLGDVIISSSEFIYATIEEVSNAN